METAEKFITIVAKCQKCGKVIQVKMAREHYEKWKPFIIYCTKCNDFTVAKVVKILEDEEKIIFY